MDTKTELIIYLFYYTTSCSTNKHMRVKPDFFLAQTVESGSISSPALTQSETSPVHSVHLKPAALFRPFFTACSAVSSITRHQWGLKKSM